MPSGLLKSGVRGLQHACYFERQPSRPKGIKLKRKNLNIKFILFMLAGFTRLANGAYSLNHFGQGPLPQPISPGVYGIMFEQ